MRVEPAPIETKGARVAYATKFSRVELCHTIMATNESAADAASLALPVSCQGFLMKHGGFFFKKVPASLEIALFLSDTHPDSICRCKSDSSLSRVTSLLGKNDPA
jgi:hypothetical protein